MSWSSYNAAISSGSDLAGKSDPVQAEFANQRAKTRLFGAAADERQGRVRKPLLNQVKCPNRARDVVEALEVAGRENPWPQCRPLSKPEAAEVDHVGDHARVDAESGEDADEEARRDDVALHGAKRPPGDARAGEVIGRLAAAIVQDDGPSEQPGDQNGREGRQQKRGIRGREHVDDVCAANLREERRNIDELVDDRPQVFDRPGESKRSGKRRVHWNQPRLNFSIAFPLAEQPAGLNGLAAEDFQRWRHERHPELAHANGGVANDTPSEIPGSNASSCVASTDCRTRYSAMTADPRPRGVRRPPPYRPSSRRPRRSVQDSRPSGRAPT